MHHFDEQVAVDLGIPAAIILANLAFLQRNRELQGGDEFNLEGKWWVRYSYEGLAANHPYLSIQQIRRVMKKLEELGHVTKTTRLGNPWDRTLYWHVSPEFIHVAESTDRSVASDRCHVSKSTDVLHDNNIEHIRPKTSLKPSGNSDPKFNQFWDRYNYKVKKREALKRWSGMSKEEREDALHFVSSKEFQAWRSSKFEGGKCYLPHPSKWLNGKQWEDELVPFGGVSQESDFARLGRLAKDRDARESDR